MWTPFSSDFRTKSSSSTQADTFYDIREDWELIEASFASQYSVRLRSTPMAWSEFVSLLSSLLPETPFGRVVSIRAEKDPKVIKSFNTAQKQIFRDWKIKMAKQVRVSPEDMNRDMQALANTLEVLFKKER